MNTTTIEHNGKHYELAGEIRVPGLNEHFLHNGVVHKCTFHHVSRERYAILREVEPPAPFPCNLESGSSQEPVEAGVSYTMGHLELEDRDDGHTIILTKAAAINLARRILQHYGEADE